MVKIVTQMLIRNEVDIIAETLSEILRWGVETIVILDGGSDDGTINVINDWADEYADIVTVDLHIIPDPEDEFHDHQRNLLLDLSRWYDPDWIISLDADEIYHTDPIKAILAAEAEGANVVWQDIPQFWITYDDIRNGLLVEDPSVSIQERRRWYSWGHTGCFIWKDNLNHYYPKATPKRTPEMLNVPNYRDWQVEGSIRPICKHYCFRSLQQAVKRMQERLERGGRKYFGKYAEDWIINEIRAGLHYWDGREWHRTYNHDKVCEYMGRWSR